MNIVAAELKPGMQVLQKRVVSPDAWLELADPPLDWASGGGWVELLFTDGSRSRPMDAAHRVEVRTAAAGPAL